MQLTRSSMVFLLGLAWAAQSVPTAAQAQAKPKFDSKIVTAAISGHAVNVDVDITGAKSLFLLVQDGGDGFTADWADWVEPKLVGPKDEVKLTELKWKSATTGFGKVRVNANCEGHPLQVAGKSVAYGIGTHANSLIEYALPDDSKFTKFTAKAALDEGGTKQGTGSTVQFLVFIDKPDAKYLVATAGNGAAAGVGSRDPLDAVQGLDVAAGLEATLFASEASGLLSPADIDVDHLGRVWVCEVVNYRHRKGERKEGDRILVVEDTNGDGVSDKQTVFFQGPEVDSALGIGVFPTPNGKGTKAFVSCAPNVWIFTDEDGDLKADKKELLFTNVGQPQHDHSTHAFIFGPDGKLYWNVGNTGKQVCDAAGKPIVDLAGNVVSDAGQPYRQGLVFRCNVDGSQFEVLGNNFRNNYEVTVDSFGTLWQSDNDDDGNKGVRINYVMEFGNFGYVDEITGAGWRTPRTNLEAEVPLQHWHLNDPGVVPNLVQTGAGSPTGICFYEGTLLPKIFHNAPIHCDAGPNVVRAYPTKKSGAGYSAEIVDILNGTRDNWFRPSDVCVAPDGSLIVSDWYDPGVGGHRMGDADKGRLFRVAPPKTPYKIAPADVSTVAGAIEALKNPNLATRYLGWTALRAMGDKAEAALVVMAQLPNRGAGVVPKDPSPQMRARAMWLLSKLKDKGLVHVSKGLYDVNSDIRVAAIRAGRQLVHSGAGNVTVETDAGNKRLSVTFEESVIRSQLHQVLTNAPLDPAVLREVAIALHLSKSSSKPLYWAELASRHDGQDRWYLEALGIGAGNDWDACFDAWLHHAGDKWNTPSGRDIVWRSRAKRTPALLAKIISDPSTTADQCPRYLRAFDFLSGPEKEDALVQLAFATTGDEKKTQIVMAEALNRLKGFDVSQNEQQKGTLNRILEGLKGQPQFIALVEKFSVVDRYPELALLAAAQPDDQIGIDAVRVLLAKQQVALLATLLKSSKEKGNLAVGLATALSNSGDAQVVPPLLALVQDAATPADLRRQSIKGATRTKAGAAEVLKLAEAKAFDDTFTPALSAALQSAPLDATQKVIFEKLFPSPAGKDSKPLPALVELAQRKGDVGNGTKLYATTGKCATCHIVNSQGKEVGPNLSEIGSKLSRQAMFESIVFPSAGISHNYETFSAVMRDGTIFNGILISQTDEAVTLRNNEAITKTIPRQDIEELVKQKLSLMPADLAKLLSIEELTDVVEYLTTLKKK